MKSLYVFISISIHIYPFMYFWVLSGYFHWVFTLQKFKTPAGVSSQPLLYAFCRIRTLARTLPVRKQNCRGIEVRVRFRTACGTVM